MIAIVLGTRAEFIKMFPVMKELKRKKIKYFFIHTGQHYIDDLIKETGVETPDFRLDNPDKIVGRFKNIFSAFLWNLKIGIKLRELIKEIKPTYVMAQGDTMTTATVCFFARTIFKRPKICHIEAGLRSGDILEPFPEELSRMIADYFGDILFVPTKIAAKNVMKRRKVFVVGNTVIDAVKFIARQLKAKSNGKYIIAMIHRQENVKSFNRMRKFVSILKQLPYEIILIAHGHSVESLKKFGLWNEVEKNKRIKIFEVKTYSEFIKLLIKSKGIITDSGGIIEECCELKKHCLILRKKTERPEAIKAGFAKIIIKSNINEIKKFLESSIEDKKNPYGDGKTAKRIVNHLLI